MKSKKLVIIINGGGGVGKDTLCNALNTIFKIRNISSITPIKEIAAQYGWKGEKDERSRRFLADLKNAFVKYNDLPTRYLLEQYVDFAVTDEEILCVHIREKEQIEHFKSKVELPCVSILVRRDTGTHTYGNAADDQVEDYNYDFIFNNSAALEESSEAFRKLVQKIFDEKNK